MVASEVENAPEIKSLTRLAEEPEICVRWKGIIALSASGCRPPETGRHFIAFCYMSLSFSLSEQTYLVSIQFKQRSSSKVFSTLTLEVMVRDLCCGYKSYVIVTKKDSLFLHLLTFSFIFSIFLAELRLGWRSSCLSRLTLRSPDLLNCFSSCFSASFSLLSALMLSVWYMWYVFIT